MTVCQGLRSELEKLAGDLRPTDREFVSVLGVAQRLGVRVCLRLVKGAVSPAARIEMGLTPPTIYLGRSSSIEGTRYLGDREDRILTARERFSVAHELGHWIAFKELRLSPSIDKSSYWDHERCMHGFAASLLMSGQVIDSWLNTCPSWEPISPFALRHWARNVTRLSEEVVATRLCSRRSEIGFLKVSSVKRKRNGSRVLKVLFAASGDQVSIANTHAHIENRALMEKLEEDGVGTASLAESALGGKGSQLLRVAWRQAGTLKSSYGSGSQAGSPIFWISATVQRVLAIRQLALW